eukprot:PITA_19251
MDEEATLDFSATGVDTGWETIVDLVIVNCPKEDCDEKLTGEASARALWDKFGTLYQSKSMVNKSFLRKKLYNLKVKGGDLVTEHLNGFNTVVCRKCGKEGHFKKECRSKSPEKGNGSDDAPSAEVKTTSNEGGYVYLDSSSSTHVDHEAWLIDSGASFHFTPHREWLCKYDKYDGGDVFLRDESKARIIDRGKFKLKLQGGKIRTLPGVLHIPALARNLIFVSKLDDAGAKTVFKKDTCKMVWGALVLMRGI